MAGGHNPIDCHHRRHPPMPWNWPGLTHNDRHGAFQYLPGNRFHSQQPPSKPCRGLFSCVLFLFRLGLENFSGSIQMDFQFFFAILNFHFIAADRAVRFHDLFGLLHRRVRVCLF